MKKDLTTLFTGRHSIVLDEIDSTNSFLAGILRNGTLPEGAVIVALNQNAGRGQAGSAWLSEPGANMLLSFVFYPTFVSPNNIFILNKSFALGVYEFAMLWLESDIKIKWPNDIYWKNKKLGGMLIENSVHADSISQSILGLGININQRNFSSLLVNPVSFAAISGKEYDLEELFNSLCSCIEARYLQLRKGDFKKIDEDFQSALYALKEWRIYESGGKRFNGLIRGVDEKGKLRIETEEGFINTYDLKEIKYVL